MKTSFLTASELSRAVNCPLTRITHAITTGLISPDGRAGKATNAAILFNAERIESIRATLEKNAPSRRHAHSPEDLRLKAKLGKLNKARREAAK
jgi:hypothetical protein